MARKRNPVVPGRIDLASMAENADDAARLLKLLANGQRLRVMCLLFDGELSVGEINDRIDLSQSALSQHLAKLRDEGLVTTRRDAQTIYYQLDSGPAKKVIGSLHDIYCGMPSFSASRKRKLGRSRPTLPRARKGA